MLSGALQVFDVNKIHPNLGQYAQNPRWTAFEILLGYEISAIAHYMLISCVKELLELYPQELFTAVEPLSSAPESDGYYFAQQIASELQNTPSPPLSKSSRAILLDVWKNLSPYQRSQLLYYPHLMESTYTDFDWATMNKQDCNVKESTHPTRFLFPTHLSARLATTDNSSSSSSSLFPSSLLSSIFSCASLCSFADPSVGVRYLRANARSLPLDLFPLCIVASLLVNSNTSDRVDIFENFATQTSQLPYDLPFACLLPLDMTSDPSQTFRAVCQWVSQDPAFTARDTASISPTTSHSSSPTSPSIPVSDAFSIINSLYPPKQFDRVVYAHSCQQQHKEDQTTQPFSYTPHPLLTHAAEALVETVLFRFLHLFPSKPEQNSSNLSSIVATDLYSQHEPKNTSICPSVIDSESFRQRVARGKEQFPFSHSYINPFVADSCHLCQDDTQSHSFRLIGHWSNAIDSQEIWSQNQFASRQAIGQNNDSSSPPPTLTSIYPLFQDPKDIPYLRHNNPVFFTSLAQASKRSNGEENAIHLNTSLEQAVALMLYTNFLGFRSKHQQQPLDAALPPERFALPQQVLATHDYPIGSYGFWVICVDFHGFSLLQDNNPYVAVLVNRLLSKYPERLSAALLIDTGMLFSGVWYTIKTFLDPVTIAKVHFIKYSTFQSALSTIQRDLNTFRTLQNNNVSNESLSSSKSYFVHNNLTNCSSSQLFNHLPRNTDITSESTDSHIEPNLLSPDLDGLQNIEHFFSPSFPSSGTVATVVPYYAHIALEASTPVKSSSKNTPIDQFLCQGQIAQNINVISLESSTLTADYCKQNKVSTTLSSNIQSLQSGALGSEEWANISFETYLWLIRELATNRGDATINTHMIYGLNQRNAHLFSSKFRPPHLSPANHPTTDRPTIELHRIHSQMYSSAHPSFTNHILTLFESSSRTVAVASTDSTSLIVSEDNQQHAKHFWLASYPKVSGYYRNTENSSSTQSSSRSLNEFITRSKRSNKQLEETLKSETATQYNSQWLDDMFQQFSQNDQLGDDATTTTSPGEGTIFIHDPRGTLSFVMSDGALFML